MIHTRLIVIILINIIEYFGQQTMNLEINEIILPMQSSNITFNKQFLVLD